MPGTLVITTLSDGTNSTSSTNCIQGSAKAWVNYKGTATVGIRASYNVSSVTVNGTGDYTINFTNAFVDGNYCWTAAASSTGNVNRIIYGQDPSTQISSSLRVRTLQVGGSFADADFIGVSCFR